MRKFSSPYLGNASSSSQWPKRHSQHPKRAVSHERQLNALESHKMEHKRESWLSQQRSRVKACRPAVESSHPAGCCPQVYSCQISYKSRLFQLEFEYNIEHTTIGQFLQKIHQLLENSQVVVRTGVVVVDYLLTHSSEKFTYIAPQTLSFSVYDFPASLGPRGSLKQFNILKCIGSGGFSKVYLAETLGFYLALKIMDKCQIMQHGKQSIVLNERDILMKLSSHPFVTKLHYTIETEHTITFGVQFCVGGELFHLLKQQRRMSEDQARFYFLEVLSALHHAHSHGIIYRDLKPENVVIDYQGHVRLADFGLSKFQSQGHPNQSFCGSAEYMAPQMLRRVGHGLELDVYCLGALLYQLVIGLPPFYSKDMDEMFYGILKEKLRFPAGAALSSPLKHLLESMLAKEPEMRPNLSDVLEHQWCRGISLHDINSKQLQPPFRPNLLAYNFDDAEFRETQAQDMAILLAEKDEGDLVIPLFRRFYYESDFASTLKKQHTHEPLKRSVSTSDTVFRGSSSKLRLRTEQPVLANQPITHTPSRCWKRRSSSKKSLAERTIATLKRQQSPAAKQNFKAKRGLKIGVHEELHKAANISKPKPIKRVFKGNEYTRQLFRRR